MCNIKPLTQEWIFSDVYSYGASFRAAAVTRSVSKYEYGGEGRGSRDQGVAAGMW